MTTSPTRFRLLPWGGPEGKTAHLVTDGSATVLALLADSIESQQLESAAEVLKLSRAMIDAEEQPTADELIYVTRRLAECLADALRVAESRGQRVEPYSDDE
ncbi:hypothetical protein AB0H18_10700 [Streptomyces sp. NPDC020766]|uniref:hypothetical protein n=1 Tax=Streptomyces sp. NPDC020766 TaxID=3155011 RepID=UPI0033E08F99